MDIRSDTPVRVRDVRASLETVKSRHDEFVAHLKKNGKPNPPQFPCDVVVDQHGNLKVQGLNHTATASVRYVLDEMQVACAEYVFWVPNDTVPEDAIEVTRFYVTKTGAVKSGIEASAVSLTDIKSDGAAFVIVERVLRGIIESRLFQPRPRPVAAA